MEQAALISNEIFEMADRLKELKAEKKTLEATVKEINAEIERLDLNLSDAMAEAERDKFSRNGSTFYLSSRLYASPRGGMKERMIQALKQNGYGDIVSESVNANTLSSFCKEQINLSETLELPKWLGDVVTTFEKVSVGIRKS